MKSAMSTIGLRRVKVPKHRLSRLRRHPRGAVLVAVLACMVIVIVLVGGAIKSTLQGRRQCKLELQMQQAELLLQAGMDRLAVASAAGETWQPWDARLGLPEYKIAEVKYERLPASGAVVRCTARLGLSASPELAVQVSRDLVMAQPSGKSEE